MSFWQITLELLGGFGLTCLLFLLTLILAIPLGLGISFCTMSSFKPLKAVSKIFVWLIRGIPLMLLIFMIYYLPGLLGLGSLNIFNQLDRYFTSLAGSSEMLYHGRFIAVLIAFVINYSCYFSEIYRGGIQSIPAGQYEAAQVLGMTKSQTFSKVIFLQVVKRIVAPMSNEIITLVKDTALASVVIRLDLFTVAKGIVNTKAILWPIFYAGLFYLLINGLLTILLGKLEKKLGYFKV